MIPQTTRQRMLRIARLDADARRRQTRRLLNELDARTILRDMRGGPTDLAVIDTLLRFPQPAAPIPSLPSLPSVENILEQKEQAKVAKEEGEDWSTPKHILKFVDGGEGVVP